MDTSPTRQDRLTGLALDGFLFAARLTPMPICRIFGRMLGALAFCMDSRQRRIAQVNVAFAFQNELSQEEITHLVRRNFQQWGMTVAEWVKPYYIDKAFRGQRPPLFEVIGQSHWQAAKSKSDAVLLLSAHFGNWEYAHAFYAFTFNRLNFIVRSIDNATIEAKRVAANQHHGVNILYKQGGLKPAIKSLRKGQDLVIFADQNVNAEEGVECRFFGRRTSTLAIVAAMAKKYDLPVVPMFTVRKRNSGVHQLVFLPQLHIQSGDSIESIAQKQNDVMEQMIRAYPDHWLWMHRKWNHYYPEIYAGL